jgi:DNA adenine methylase
MKLKPLRSPITWFGGKGCFRRKLYPLLPDHQAYVEPFGGGGSVLIGKAPAAIEVYNDLDEGLHHFFTVLANPILFPHFWSRVTMLPYSRELYNDCLTTWYASQDPLERAVRWFVVARQSFSGEFGCAWGSCVSSSSQGRIQTAAGWQSILRDLPQIHQRLQRVQIEHCDFRDCLKRYQGPGYLAYCDPPYVASSRKGGSYAHEMTDIDHRDLVTLLLDYRGAVVLSGYPNAIYAPLEAAGWKRLNFRACCTACGRTAATKHLKAELVRTECVWLNQEAIKRRRK